MKFKIISLSIIAILIATISIQNAEVVAIKFFTWEYQISRILLILISFAVGVLTGILVSIRRTHQVKEETKPEINNNKLDQPKVLP